MTRRLLLALLVASARVCADDDPLRAPAPELVGADDDVEGFVERLRARGDRWFDELLLATADALTDAAADAADAAAGVAAADAGAAPASSSACVRWR